MVERASLEWLPLVVTAGLLVVLVAAVYVVVGRATADLVGLTYLLVSPVVYRATGLVVARAGAAAEDEPTPA